MHFLLPKFYFTKMDVWDSRRSLLLRLSSTGWNFLSEAEVFWLGVNVDHIGSSGNRILEDFRRFSLLLCGLRYSESFALLAANSLAYKMVGNKFPLNS